MGKKYAVNTLASICILQPRNLVLCILPTLGQIGLLLVGTGFPCGSAGKGFACNAGDLDSILGLGRFPGEGNGYPFQYSGLETSMDCIVYGAAKSQKKLSDFHFNMHLMFTVSAHNSKVQRCSLFLCL